MGKRKILFFDIDETLLSHKTFTIPESTKLAIKKAKENGHLAFVNTGRTKSLIGQDIKELGFDGYVCGCGTHIEVNDEVLYSKKVDIENHNDIISNIKKYNLNAVLEGEDAIYVDENGEDDFLLSNLRKQNYPIKPYDAENMRFNKMFIRYDDNQYIDNFCEDIKDMFDYIDHGTGTREIIPKGHSKGSGIDFLLNHFEVNLDDTYAFGDSNNDIPMLEHVANSIAMGNGNPELFDKVTFVTKHIDEDGIEHAMKHFKIID
ncbi:MAG: Cof-type HAD-IIB family hydrolase [Terrisporobacter sp.]|uniref:Cof-type HAD-IIB family hydrolase n=1 Tax=Terrisporobacter sp. TaxID=1965305 RepID=UPI002FCA19A3